MPANKREPSRADFARAHAERHPVRLVPSTHALTMAGTMLAIGDYAMAMAHAMLAAGNVSSAMRYMDVAERCDAEAEEWLR